MLSLTPADQWFPEGIEAVHASAGASATGPLEIVVRMASSGAVSGRFPHQDRDELIGDLSEWLVFLAQSRGDDGTAPFAEWAHAVATQVADACVASSRATQDS